MVSEIQKELCRRLKAQRILFPLTQEELSRKTGLSLRSIINFENGNDAKLSTLISIMEQLGLEESILAMVPDPDARPSIQFKKTVSEKTRQRVRKRKNDTNKKFIWSEDL